MFTSRPQPTRSETFTAPASAKSFGPRPPIPRRRSGTAASSSVTRTGSSWDTGTRSGTTLASSQLPSSRSLSMISGSPDPPRRAPSIAGTSPGTNFSPRHVGPGGITLPLNNSVSQLVTLSHSNHTLSPYARGHEHIAVRSFPHLGKPHASGSTTAAGATNQVTSTTADAAIGSRIKARRKRIYRLGAKEPPVPAMFDIAQQPAITDDYPPHRLSTGSGSSSEDVARPWQGNALTHVAHRVMQTHRSQPSYGRAPDSRSSYGFPPALAIGSIAE